MVLPSSNSLRRSINSRRRSMTKREPESGNADNKDFEGRHDSEAALEQWSSSPVVPKQSPRSGERPKYKTQLSDPGVLLGDALPSTSFEHVDATRSRSEGTSNRAKRLMRLKQKAKMDQLIRQERKNGDACGDARESSSNSSLPKIDTSEHVVNFGNNMSNDNEKEYSGNITPSTAASTRSFSTKSSSLRNTMSGLTLNDSFSPSGHESLISMPSSSPRTMASPSNHNASQPSSPASPVSRSSKATNNESPKSRSSYSELRIVTQNRAPPPPPPRRSSSAADDWDTSCVVRSPVATDAKVSQHSRSRRSSSSSSMSKGQHHRSIQDSDEEREKVDTKTTSRQTEQAVSSDNRQQHPSSYGDTITGRTNRIKLHVYDLIAEEVMMQLPWGCNFPIGTCFNVVNSGLHTLGTGAYHVGIEINGIEYAFGANNLKGMTGVFTCVPMKSPGYQYRTTIDFGDRALIRSNPYSRRGDNTQPNKRYVDGREVVREMAVEYMGLDYDLLRKNCVTFAHDACLRLGVNDSEVPEWFRNLCLAGAAAQDAANSTMEPLSKAFASCDMEGFAELVQGTGFEVISNEQSGRSEKIIETQSCSGKQ